ncbi:MAG: NADH-quinone oxidoreductase subunit J family protein [Candidatus Polarisedimenticolia bacterium]
MELLIGLIALAVVFTGLRALRPGRPAIPAAILILGTLILLGLYHRALLQTEFWAGLIGFCAILSALLVVIHPNPMVSVLFLILNLFCVALFYLMLQAQFLAALQIIIYAGAIMVLFLFVIMLLNLRAEEGVRPGGGAQRAGGLLLGAAFAGAMFWAIQNRMPPAWYEPAAGAGFGTAREVGVLLFGRHVFAFEAASVLLLAAMIGAVLLAKRRLQ